MTYKDEEQIQRIESILENCDHSHVSPTTLSVFHQLLKHVLPLPCEVVEKRDLIHYILYDIENSGDEMFGLLGKLKLAENEKQEQVIPLCDLKAVDNRSKEFMILDDYGSWFVNAQE